MSVAEIKDLNLEIPWWQINRLYVKLKRKSRSRYIIMLFKDIMRYSFSQITKETAKKIKMKAIASGNWKMLKGLKQRKVFVF